MIKSRRTTPDLQFSKVRINLVYYRQQAHLDLASGKQILKRSNPQIRYSTLQPEHEKYQRHSSQLQVDLDASSKFHAIASTEISVAIFALYVRIHTFIPVLERGCDMFQEGRLSKSCCKASSREGDVGVNEGNGRSYQSGWGEEVAMSEAGGKGGGRSTHSLETRRREKVSKTNMVMGEKHALPRDEKARKNEKARKSEQDKHGRWGKSMHELETRRREQSEQDKHGRWGKSTHFLETRRQEKVSKTNMGEKHARARDEKVRKSEQDKYGRWGKSTHSLEARRREKRQEGKKSEQDKHGRWGKSTHFLETKRREKRREGEKKDEKARKSEQDKHGRWGKSTHFLETRRREKVSKTNMGVGGKARIELETRRREKVSKTNMGDGGKHALPRDEKARKK
ncbi:hypothetical protein B0H14DRAFT_2613558 [Mycena olivaceomarginata]|nr:hypothetical protein B0H14DRAFT_2613558 [Mycena olivaceomarginata]